jgi:putative membrane protein
MDLSGLPPVNASLNALATVLLVVGRRQVRAGRIDAHRRTMIAATATSALFLAFYVAHKVSRNFENTSFNMDGPAQAAYLAMLASHVILAATIPFFAVTLVVLGLRDRRDRHRRIARIAWPIWIYVSVTGVLIYLLLYPLNPAVG